MSLPVKKIYVGTERCGLCRSQLPWSGESDLTWDLNFRAAICLEPNDENTIEITRPASLSDIDLDSDDQQIEVRLTGDSQTQSVDICHYQRNFYRRMTYPTAYCFHDWCYETLIQKVERCTEPEIYKLSQILSLDSVVWESRHLYRQQIEDTSSETLRRLADSYQPLHKLLHLPVELRDMVWNYIGLKTPFSASVLVSEETTRLLHALKRSSCQTVSLTQGARISVRMLTVFGTPYIQSLTDGGCPEIIPGVVTYLKFAMVNGGICAVKLYGSDWNTSWLGVLPNWGCTWYGCIRNPGNTLACSSNGLYFTSLSSLDDQVFWDQPDIPDTVYNPDKELFDFKRDMSRSYELDKSRLRYFGYLPLLSDNSYANSLTVYLSANGIVGIESHFTKTSRLIGRREGCPRHFPFHPGERIAFAWLCIINSESYAMAAPAMTIQTTYRRIHSFGPYIFPHYVLNDMYKWILLDGPGFITGFYVEYPYSLEIMRIGVIRERDSLGVGSPNLEFTACRAAFLPHVGPNAGLFMSVADLSNLRKVEVCRVGVRCTGLKLYYIQAPTVVLGQWYTTGASQYASIFNGNGPNIKGIRFKLSTSGEDRAVTDISFGTDISDDCNSSYFRLGETITWWFSKSHDVIRLWDGKVLPVPKGSINTFK
ncbi:hypothetical protein ONS95_001479 [Cadophora gregata]|uniref:uncharacterized protein n=1 Tax=Cadophora gregata TaxID=51156 RepID=UPI0026DC9DF0|nr:uncharacterized protein ONS95_001479 [Cadophora gregata]KAK0111101.1 hypothetical protein ONS95_001479 [Cadophora gregata]KAK0112430.1 hypothetical protein ONS96_001672 [Cadophora gregata f. sp. sojae]